METAQGLLEEQAHAGTWSLDLKTEQVWWSDGTYRIFGLRSGDLELTLQTALDFYPAKAREILSEAITQSISDGSSYSLNLEVRRADGRIIPIFCSGRANLVEGVPVTLSGVIFDLEAIEQERVRQHTEAARFQTLVRYAPYGLAMMDADQQILMVNPAFCRMLGYQDTELIGCTTIELTHPDDLPIAAEHKEQLFRGNADSCSYEKRFRHKEGHWVWVELALSILRDGNGGLLNYIGQYQDIRLRKHNEEELERVHRQLAYQAEHDYLTDLPNRAATERMIVDLLADENCVPDNHFLLFLDIDHFNLINDTSGHAAGDSMVKDIANLLRQVFDTDTFLARFGGDEFVLVLHQTSPEQAQKVAEKILEAVNDFRFVYGERSYQGTVSIGITQIAGAPGDLSRILAQADAACYLAKTYGRGRYRFFSEYDPALSLAQSDLEWAQRIRRALATEQFRLFYQEIVDANGTILGSEALIRLLDEQGGYIPPIHFLPAADRMGLITMIDRWVCRKAADILGRAAEQPLLARRIGAYMTVNLSARTLGDADFADWLLELLDARPQLSQWMRIEITETEKCIWSSNEVALVTALRKRGIRVLLDDFGMGYNSFEVLKRITVDGIKLDRQVVKDIESDPVDNALAVAAVAIARNLGIQLVAEGVETPESLETLRQLGILCFQGHLFHLASPIEDGGLAALSGRKPTPFFSPTA